MRRNAELTIVTTAHKVRRLRKHLLKKGSKLNNRRFIHASDMVAHLALAKLSKKEAVVYFA